ncbi:hypothetical protein CBR_g25975 [Chara braunii]|uniref:RNA-directed DNA polymerase n=1 Tax=Chara braunii TaxID=69332 RepID=A0A388L6U9_CHABU|nr:hypothetical protein CBR_g25975 [Chara braunii]|eukprot:GBG78040.1 hypothetical protein CBR_g25975 [Chara braunii]
MTILTRSQTTAMDQKAGESDEACEARLAAIIAESKQRAEAAAAAQKKREAEAERLRLLAEEQRQKHAVAAAKAADEERVRRREVIFREEGALHAQAKDWQREAESGESVDYGSRVSHLLNRVTNLLATCIAQQEDIHSLDHTNKVLQQSVDQMLKRIQQLEQQVATANTSIGPSNLIDRVNVLEIDVGTVKTGAQQLQQQSSAPAGPSATTRETIAKFDGLPIFCDASKTDPIQWWRQFELKLDIHHVIDANRHAYLNSRSGGACQTWLDNMLSAHALTFDVLDMDFDIILGMLWLASADHTVNFHRRTLVVRDVFGAEVPCTVPLPHPSIRCQVVTAKSFRATCAYERTEEIGLCFLRTVAVADSQPTDLSSDPRVVRLLDEFADIFESPTGVVPDRPISHEIILEAGVVLPKGCIYRMSEEELTVLRAQLDNLLDKGWIRPSSSPYGAPVLFVRKKNKDLRLCIDYRKLNAQTVKNAGPLPRIDDFLERLGGAIFFSKLDLKSGYHQISIRPQDRYKTVFKTRYGHFVVMSFGLTNALATFQAAMTNEFRAMLDRFVLVYLDDILVYSQTLEEHLDHLRPVLETLRHAKFKANRDKCEFVCQELEYLGHFVTPQGSSPLSDKIQAVQDWPEPRNITDVQSFLGLAGYYQRFIKGYSKIAAHLTKLQCKDRPFDFGTNTRESFLVLKAALLSAEVLRIYDPLLPTRVTTDASGYGIGVVLEQHDGVEWHLVEYFSKKVSAVHSIDDARKKELLAFVHALERWRHFLLGRRQFRWVTDNNPLVFYKSQDTVNNTIAHWMAFIDQFDFFPDHILGKSNRFADALSRRPDHCTAVYSTFGIEDDLRDSFICGYQADPEFRDKEAIAMDIIGPFPKHKTGVDGILTVVDRLTKFAMFLPCRYHAKAPELAEVLCAGWIRSKGYPKEIVCDRDTRFMSDFWLALIKRWGSSLKPSLVRHPQTDGQTERAHQTAQVLLQTLIRPDHKDWVERLPDVELAYNSSIHLAIGMSPFEFEHGSPVNSSLDTIIPRAAESDDHLLFIRRMQELLVKARDQMAKTQ